MKQKLTHEQIFDLGKKLNDAYVLMKEARSLAATAFDEQMISRLDAAIGKIDTARLRFSIQAAEDYPIDKKKINDTFFNTL